jgi:hypothetical protein
MAKNLGNLVSRVLDGKRRNWDSVVFQQKRPPLDSEFNLFQDILSDKISEILRISVPSGFLELGDFTGAPDDRNLLKAGWKNSLKFKNPVAVVNGWVLKIGGGTNQFQENTLTNVWEDLSNDEEEVAFLLADPPVIASREDLIFLEVWQKLITTNDFVFKDGFVQSAQPKLTNDLIDSNLSIETSKRIQIQYRIRRYEGVDFESFREGINFPGVLAQGPRPDPVLGYRFSKHSEDAGLFVAGNGSVASQNALGTVDGFVYAIPIARVHRRNKQSFSLTNQNGSNKSILDGGSSGRPDGLYNDEINIKDIEDLRHLVSLDGYDFDGILNQNLYDIFTRKNPSELKRSSLDESVVGSRIIQVDGISGSSVTGVDTNARIPDGFKRVFSESKEIQKVAFTISGPALSSGRLWFTAIGRQDNSFEYQLYNEQKFYPRKIEGTYTPQIFEYDEATKKLELVAGGTWTNLGDFRTYNYLTGNRNKFYFTPGNLSDIQGKKIVILFDMICREGGGLADSKGGFNFHIEKMLEAFNNKDSRPVEFNDYRSTSNSRDLISPRTVSIFRDSAISRSISRFEEASPFTSLLDDKFKGGCLEVTYYVLSSGLPDVLIPREIYGRQVCGIFSVVNVDLNNQFLNFGVEIQDDGSGWRVTGLTTAEGNILRFTILTGNYTVDFSPHSRGVTNVASVFRFQSGISVGEREIVLNVKNVITSCDAALANAGFFNGVTNSYAAYINGKRVAVSSIVGLGTPAIKYTLQNPSLESGNIEIYFLGYYNPSVSDQMWFAYEHTPYKGIINTRITATQDERFLVKKVDPNVTVSTAGTGSSSQFVSDDLLGLASTLPVSNATLEYNLFGSNIETSISGGLSSLRRIPGRGFSYDPLSQYLREGLVLSLGINPSASILRGVTIKGPLISERGFDLNIPITTDGNGNLIVDPDTGQTYDLVFNKDLSAFNHVTIWSAVVESLDSFKGELFLLLITTYSTVYNREEAPVYRYLSDKNLYKEAALGLGRETILKNNLSSFDLAQNLGSKIIGAADIFPLRGRPLTK